jgi:hypothetical protein
MHFARAAVIFLCLLTEIQHYFKFEGANIDKRLRDIWTAMLAIYELNRTLRRQIRCQSSAARFRGRDLKSKSDPGTRKQVLLQT